MIELPAPHLADGLIRLRPWDDGPGAEDAAALAQAWTDAEVARWTRVPAPHESEPLVEKARQWIAGDAQRRAADLSLDLAIVSDDDPERVFGEVGLSNIDFDRSGAEIGFWIGPAHRGQGLGSRAIALLSDWTLHGPLHLGRVYARTDPENVASARALAGARFLVRGRLSSGHDLWSLARP